MPSLPVSAKQAAIELWYFSTKQVAERLGCSTQTIAKLIKTGKLRAIYLSQRSVRIAAAEVRRYEEANAYRPEAPRGRRRTKAEVQ